MYVRTYARMYVVRTKDVTNIRFVFETSNVYNFPTIRFEIHKCAAI